MPKYLIVNADDFGVSAGVNRGIMECHTHGVVTSASLMVKRPAVQEAVAISRDHPGLAVGLHWDAGGEGAEELNLDNRQLVRDEFERQLETFFQLLGRMPTHIDSEGHTHRSRELLPLFQELVGPLDLPLRAACQVRFVGGFYAQWYYQVTNLKYVSVPFFQQMLREDVREGWTEFSCHPGYLSTGHDPIYNFEREAEVRTLTDPRIRQTIDELDIRLVSYAEYRQATAGVTA